MTPRKTPLHNFDRHDPKSATLLNLKVDARADRLAQENEDTEAMALKTARLRALRLAKEMA